MKKKIIASWGGLMFLTPMLVLAQEDIPAVLTNITSIFSLVVPLVFAVAIVYFLWGLTKFITSSGGDAEAHEEGRNIMIWGVIAIFVMASVWGLVKILQNTFELEDSSGSVEVPQIPTER